MPIVHEIHRSRFSGHPALLRPYLERLPGLRLTADLAQRADGNAGDEPGPVRSFRRKDLHVHIEHHC